MANIGFVTETMNRIDTVFIREMVHKSWIAFSHDWRIAIPLLITILLITFGIQLLAAAKGANTGSMLKSLVFGIFAFVLATNWTYFVLFILDTFLTIPNEIAGIFTRILTQKTGGGAYSGLDDLWTRGMGVVQQLLNDGGWSPGFLIIAFLYLIVFVGSFTITVGILIVVKIMLAIMLFIAPLVLPFMIFATTRGIFLKWVQSTIGLGITQCTVIAALVFMMGIIETGIFVSSKIAGSELSLHSAVIDLVMMAGSVVAFYKSYRIGEQLGGGFGSGLSPAIEKMIIRSTTPWRSR